MTGIDDTGNPAQLPLAERARRGDALEIHEILELEFPGGRNPDYQRWRQLIEQAIRFDRLPVYLEVEDDGCLPGTELICRRDYLAWRDRQSGSPVNSLIEAWRPSAGEPDRPDSGAASEPDKSKSGAAAKRAALAQLLDELDKRAAEQGAEFDRHSLPGTKAEFARLLKAHCPTFGYIGIDQTDAYLNGECQFQPGAKTKQGKGAAVWALFPEYDLK